jgi:pimeloyl-ACP methyl ester carboxylesterase
MKSHQGKDGKFFYQELGQTNDPNAPVFIWAHGWGQSHAAFRDVLPSFTASGRHIVIDFPGFGSSPEPDTPWSTKDSADLMAEFIRAQGYKAVLWIGHSFGVRVGLQMCAHYPDLMAGMVNIAGAGLKLKRPPIKAAIMQMRIYTYKTLKFMTRFGLSENWLKNKFGSQDYRNVSGIMRQVFINVVNEHLEDEAKTTSCPCLLIYGENDTEAPPEIGKRLNFLIPNSIYIELPGQDHYSPLASGRHQVIHHLNSFIKDINFAKK